MVTQKWPRDVHQGRILDVEHVEIRYTKYDIRNKIYEIRNMKYEIRNTIYEIRYTNYVIRNTLYEIRKISRRRTCWKTIYEIRYTKYEVWNTKYEIRNMIYEIRYTKYTTPNNDRTSGQQMLFHHLRYPPKLFDVQF